jgi:hypothetical protein
MPAPPQKRERPPAVPERRTDRGKEFPTPIFSVNSDGYVITDNEDPLSGKKNPKAAFYAFDKAFNAIPRDRWRKAYLM